MNDRLDNISQCMLNAYMKTRELLANFLMRGEIKGGQNDKHHRLHPDYQRAKETYLRNHPEMNSSTFTRAMAEYGMEQAGLVQKQ